MITESFAREMEQLQPFGQDNPEPVFLTKGVTCISHPVIIKEKHLKFSAKNDVQSFEIIGFGMGGRQEEWRQALGKLGKPPEAVIKTWRHGGGVKDLRQHHEDMNGVKVRGLNTPFILPTGARMQHALDPDGGVAECVNCSCGTDFRIDHSWGLT